MWIGEEIPMSFGFGGRGYGSFCGGVWDFCLSWAGELNYDLNSHLVLCFVLHCVVLCHCRNKFMPGQSMPIASLSNFRLEID